MREIVIEVNFLESKGSGSNTNDSIEKSMDFIERKRHVNDAKVHIQTQMFPLMLLFSNFVPK